MNKPKRVVMAIFYAITVIIISVAYYIFHFIRFDSIKDIILSSGYIFSAILLTNDVFYWVKRGSRGESFDILVLIFLFFGVYLFTNDVMNSFIGAFSIYLIFGIMELKEYEVLNKILIITVITYNFIFFAGLINSYMKIMGLINTDVIRDTAFSFSLWIMLILGFILFGRKYIIVLRFMSPNYLTLFLFVIAWLAIRYLSKWLGVDYSSLIYLFLIITNWLVYIFSGPILDWTLGIKRTDDQKIKGMVKEVQGRIGLRGKIKVGFGRYPILNAMAYGAVFDKRIAIIAPNKDTIPEDELKGIIGHELSHTKGGIANIPDTLMLSIISTLELIVFWVLKWPATYYDYVFNPENQPFPIWVFILINILLSIVIYVFVRILESRADYNTKVRSLDNELAKGLYNLEGFYANGREIGLDTMLLCDEKLLDYNKVSNYANTAQYLYNNMIFPSKLTLLSNLMNSHPPTYHREIAIYGKLGSFRESLLPFILMNNKKRIKFAFENEDARLKYVEMANLKFKNMFKIENYADYQAKLNKKELFITALGKLYIYIDELNMEVGTGILKDIKYNDDICSPISFGFLPVKLYTPDLKELRMIGKKVLKIKEQKNGTSRIKIKSKSGSIKSNEIKREVIINLIKKASEIGLNNEGLMDEGSNNSDSISTSGDNEEKLVYKNPYLINLIEINPKGNYTFSKNGVSHFAGIYIPDLDDINNQTTKDSRQPKIKYLDYKRFINKLMKESFLIFIEEKAESDENARDHANENVKKKESKSNNTYIAAPDGDSAENIDLEGDKKNKDSAYTIYCLSLMKAKMAFDISILEDYAKENKEIFLEEQGTLSLLKFKEFIKESNYTESKIICEKLNLINKYIATVEQDTDENKHEFLLKDLYIQRNEFGVIIHGNENTFASELNLLEFLKNKKIRTTFYLKKPINNVEAGYITLYNYHLKKDNVASNNGKADKEIDDEIITENDEKTTKEYEKGFIQIRNIYSKEIKIPITKIEMLIFAYNSITINDKRSSSIGEKILKKIRHRRDPQNNYA
ncbi:MAG: M48 family metalloprotease [Promethearchaeota archaeon]